MSGFIYEDDEELAEKRERTLGSELRHQGELTARYLAGGPVKALTGINDAFLMAWNGIAPEGLEVPMLSPRVDQALDAAGLDRPEGELERYIGNAAEFTSGGMLPFGTASRVAGTGSGGIQTVGREIAETMTRGGKTQMAGEATAGLANQAAQDAELGPVGTTVATVAGQATPAGVTRGTRAVLGGGTNRVADNLNTFDETGIEPLAGDVGTASASVLQAAPANVPGGVARVEGAMDNQTRQAQNFVDQTLNRQQILEANPTRAGQEVIRSVDEGVQDFQKNAEARYEAVDELIPARTPVFMENTTTYLNERVQPVAGAERTLKQVNSDYLRKFGINLGEDLERALDTQGVSGLPYQAVRRIRTAIGQKIGRPQNLEDISKAELRGLYGAISKDLESAAVSISDEAALAARRANQYYRAGMNRFETVEKLIKNKTPERVYQAVMSGTDLGATQLRQIWKTMDMEAQDYVTGTVLQRMGRASAGNQNLDGDAFSFNTYLTNYNRLSPEAKKILFGNNPQLREATEALARTSDLIKTNRRTYANPSGTGRMMALVSQLGGLGGGVAALDPTMLATAAGSAVASNALSRLVTNRNFMNWLAKNNSATAPGEIEAALSNLIQMSAHFEDPDMQIVAEALLEQAKGGKFIYDDEPQGAQSGRPTNQ